jgi:hypothetical protein
VRQSGKISTLIVPNICFLQDFALIAKESWGKKITEPGSGHHFWFMFINPKEVPSMA